MVAGALQQSLIPALYPEMSPEERLVWGVLQNHVGRAHAITWEEICQATGLDNRKARAAKETLVNVYRKPIGSSTANPPGVFVLRDEKELEEVCGRYHGQAMSQLRTVASLRRIGLDELLGRLQLQARGG